MHGPSYKCNHTPEMRIAPLINQDTICAISQPHREVYRTTSDYRCSDIRTPHLELGHHATDHSYIERECESTLYFYL